MKQTLGQYIDTVRLWVDELTDGVVDYDDLIDFADGPCSPGDCYADGVPAKTCAKRILKENGADWL